jgi:hypothetical protein
MLCKIWGVHDGNYEECRLLRYINPVRTSQETHYFSATEPSQLMLCKISGFYDSDYEECRLLGYKNPVRTSQETHYVSATDPSQLMLCKIWGVHGSDYEECRLLGYMNPVRTSQETHYVSVIEPSRLILYKTLGFHCGYYEECRLLGRYFMWLLWYPTFRRNIACSITFAKLCKLRTTLTVTSNWNPQQEIHQFLLTTNVPSSLILFTLMIVTKRSSETSALTTATHPIRRHSS